MGFVISLNLNRRHLTTGQKAAIAVEMLPMLQAEAKERQRYHGGTAPGRSKDETLSIKRCEVNEPSTRRNRATEVAANMVGISSPTVERMAKVTRESPELAGQVKSGEKTVEKAYRELHPRKKSIPELAKAGIPAFESKQQVGTFVCKELDTGNPAPEQKQAVKKVVTAGRGSRFKRDPCGDRKKRKPPWRDARPRQPGLTDHHGG